MSRFRPLGALFALALTVAVTAPTPASASGTDASAVPTALSGDTGAPSLPAGTTACPPTATKPSTGTAACTGGQPDGEMPLSAFSVSLTAGREALVPGETTTLTAVSSQDVGPTPYFIEIFDFTTGTFVTACASGTTCFTSVTESGSIVRAFVASVSTLGAAFPPPGIQATSSRAFVSWLTVALSASPTALAPGGASLVTATASLDVGPTPFYLQVFDLRSGERLVVCASGATCATSVTRDSGVSQYAAFVSRYDNVLPLPDVRAMSTPLLVSWISLDLAASPASLKAAQTATLAATASLDVGGTPWSIQVFDQTAGTLVALCKTGDRCSAPVTQPTSTRHTYVAFVATPSSALPPPDIRATSSAATVEWLPAAVPDLIGQPQDQASAELSAAGLALGTVGTAPDCSNLDLVASQSPAPGTLVDPGTAVSIAIGREPCLS